MGKTIQSINEFKEMKRVLFYSSVRDKELFNIQQFYRIDIQILEELGYNVILSNEISDAWAFWRYDFVFAYFYRYAFFVALIAKLFWRNTYFTGGIDALDKNLVSEKEYKVQKWFLRACYWLSKSCIIVSKTDDENVRNIVGGKKLSYSEHTIDISRYDCELKNKENICTTIAWQATVGNVKRKGVDNALRLFAILHQVPEYAQYKFVIMGKTGEGTTYLKEIVEELGIGNFVEFTDSISEHKKVDYLKRSKIYFQLSKYEGFGVASLEALCAKNIVVHSGKGGLSNPIYKDGIMLDIDQPTEEMFKRLIAGLDNFDESKLEHAHDNVCKNYDNERRNADFMRIIKD